jgi:hypothetical protein
LEWKRCGAQEKGKVDKKRRVEERKEPGEGRTGSEVGMLQLNQFMLH